MWRVLLLSLLCLFLSSCWSWRDVLPGGGTGKEDPANPYEHLAVWSQWIGGIGIIVSIVSLVFTQGASVKWSVKLLAVSFTLALLASVLGWMSGNPFILLLLAFVALCSLLAWWLYSKSERFRRLFEEADDKQASLTGIEITEDNDGSSE